MATLDIDGEVEQRYRILRHIGSGAYGVVWCAQDLRTGKPVALKKVFDAFSNQQDAQRTYREVLLLQHLRGNDAVVELLNVIQAVNDVDLYLIFELAETDLTMVLHKNILQDVHRKFLAYQIVKVVAHLHARCIIHRDLKPSNVFVSSDCRIKLGDFGLARSFSPKSELGDQFADLTEYIATRWYRAPEILTKSAVYTTAMDMWAIGCIIGELLVGKPLFMGNSTLHQLSLIIGAIGVPNKEDVDSLEAPESWTMLDALPPPTEDHRLSERLTDCDPDAVDLLLQLIVFNPTRRLSALMALEHPYLKEFYSPEDRSDILGGSAVALPLADSTHYPALEYKAHIYDIIAKEYRHAA